MSAKVALIQMKGFSDKEKTIEKMKTKVMEAAAGGFCFPHWKVRKI